MPDDKLNSHVAPKGDPCVPSTNITGTGADHARDLHDKAKAMPPKWGVKK